MKKKDKDKIHKDLVSRVMNSQITQIYHTSLQQNKKTNQFVAPIGSFVRDKYQMSETLKAKRIIKKTLDETAKKYYTLGIPIKLYALSEHLILLDLKNQADKEINIING